MIVLTVILLTIISGLVSLYIIKPEYQTYTTMMVGRPKDYAGKMEYNDVLINQRLITTYGEIAKSKRVANELIRRLGLDISSEKLSKKINVMLVKDTEIIKIAVKDKNPVMAAKIADEISFAFIKNVSDIMKIENIQIIDKAEIPVKPVKPKIILNMTMSFILGLTLGAFIVFFAEYLDNTLKTPEDVENYLGLPVIGVIPKISN